ncbi:glycosyltransferase [Psychrobacter glacincola]|uniref:Glycosyltransferase n=1 Tax=Psychrobacter glacincola TaxID=56810 RepID=A0ABW1W787_9GAMM|nr:glycosyltransferase family 2 protein [Psychrobacter glacincola]
MYVSLVLYQHTLADIQTTLDSLLHTDSVDKVILVDNGGCNWADHLGHTKIAYIKAERNGGFGYGHNLAIRKYTRLSDYFLICNPDIDFDPKELEKLLEVAKSSSAGLYSPKIIYPDGTDQYGQRLLPTPLNLFARRFLPQYFSDRLDDKYLLKTLTVHLTLNKPAPVPSVSGSFMLFKSKCLLALGGFDERYFMYMEDMDLSRRCAVRFGVLYVPSACVIHEHQQASYKNKALLKAHIISAVKYFNKWGWVFDKQRRQINNETLSTLKETD